MNQKRCGWVKLSDADYVAYHDNEWGRPLHDDRALFELFSLETQAAGLSWLTVLKKREGYRKAFEGFDLHAVAAYDEARIDAIVASGLVIKSKPKITAIVENAKLFVRIVQEFGSIDRYFWNAVGGSTIVNDVPDYATAPCHSTASDALTKDLKKRGFKFVGTVTVYAFMQAAGLVNDHENDCFCKHELRGLLG
ncbi:MAG: DNA-3-methyladenine glycosylase I [Campylobacterales bacterium]